MKLYPGEYTPATLVAIASSKNYRTAVSPFGMPAGQVVRYVGKAVKWKFLRGEDFWNAVESAPEDDPLKAVGRGLKKAIEISKAAKNTFGVALVRLHDGRTVILPRKVVRQMQIAGKEGVSVISELPYGMRAKDIRKKYGIRGEYKAFAPTVAVAVPAPV